MKSKKSLALLNGIVNAMTMKREKALKIALNVIILGSALAIPIALLLAVLIVIKKIIGL